METPITSSRNIRNQVSSHSRAPSVATIAGDGDDDDDDATDGGAGTTKETL